MVELKITENKGFKNIDFKEKTSIEVEVNGKMKPMQVFVMDGESVIIEKVFKDGREIVSSKYKKADGSPAVSYLCKAQYEGEVVGFFLSERQHEAYKVLGDMGSKIKVSGQLMTEPRDYINLTFDLVE